MIVRLALFLCAFPALVSAAAFEIRSGEHDGFSRLVIYLDRAREWDLVATETGYALSVAEAQDGFDTSEVFAFIPRRRLTGIASAPDRLELAVDCDCPVQAFAYRPDILVLDIHSNPPDAAAVPDGRIVPPFEKPETDPVETAETETRLAPEPMPGRGGASSLPPWAARPPSSMRAGSLLGFAPAGGHDGQRLDHAELVAGIAQAASHGLVTLSEPGERAAAAEFPAVAGLRLSGRQVSVRDSVLRSQPPGDLPSPAQNCLPTGLFAVHDWGAPDVPASVVLSELRSGGRAGPSAADDAIATVRSYIYLGFGSEAAELVRTYRMSRSEERAYGALAAIVDFPGRADSNPLADQLRCEGGAPLWAFVATVNRPAEDDPIDAENVLRHFQRLPPWLRIQIGATAATNFDARGDAVSAEAIRASVARARAAEAQQGEDPAQAQEMADAALEGGDHHAQSDRAHRMRAAQDLLREHGSDAALALEDRAEIAALVLETRGSAESVSLLASYAQFAAAPEDILNAEQLVTVLARSRFANRYPLRMARDALLAAAIAQPSHDVFLGVLARNRRAFSSTPPSRVTADAAVARLRATGLPQAADDYARVLDASSTPDALVAVPSVATGETADAGADGSRDAPSSDARTDEGALFAAGADGSSDAAALRALLAQSRPSSDGVALSGTSEGRAPNPGTTPLDTLREAQGAIEILDRILDRAPAAGG